MALADTRTAPTRADAQRAAEAVLAAAQGDAEVYVYGSVARGDATARSDIDLYVVFTDIDYDERRNIEIRLTQATREVVPFHVQLYVSDLPEWESRRAVTNTFEHQISTDTVLLCGRAPRDKANWNKTCVRPMTEKEETQKYLKTKVDIALINLSARMVPPLSEQPRKGASSSRPEIKRGNRIMGVCADSSMVVEVCLKATAIMHDLHPDKVRDASHSIKDGLTQIPDEPARAELRKLVGSHQLTPKQIGKWRTEATYPDDLDVIHAEADEHLYDYLDTAIAVSHRVLRRARERGLNTDDLDEELRGIVERRNSGYVRYDNKQDPEPLARLISLD